MQNNIASNIKELENLRKRVYSGLASLTEDDINEICKELDSMIRIMTNVDAYKNEDALKLFEQIFSGLISGRVAHEWLKRNDINHFYNLGLLLVEFDNTNHWIKTIVFNYLDLFRQSIFLNRITGENRWEKLILLLIVNFNFNIKELFDQRLKQHPNKTLFNVLSNYSEERLSWDETNEKVQMYSKSLISTLGIENARTSKVAFLSENNLDIAILDIACLTTGIVNVMIPANSVTQHIEFILNKTEAELLVISNEKQLNKLKIIFDKLKYIRKVILLEGNSYEDWVISFPEFLESGKSINDKTLLGIVQSVKIDDEATIMFTSGTTGEPKGIIFTYLNIVYKRFCRAIAIPKIGEDDIFLSYLPLYHTFGRYFEMMGSLFWSAEYTFMENPSIETLLKSMQLVHPSIFISIPKKWIQIYESICDEVDIIADDSELIKSVVQKKTGGNLKYGLSAAGYLPAEIFRFFQFYGIEIMSGFGMTEATGGITMTPPKKYIDNSLGSKLPGIEIKLAPDGELLIKGAYVMKGYYGEEYSNTFIEDGWFATGDIMKMDSHNFIEIIDRKKEIYKNIKGETVAPQKIENLFRDFENIKQVFLVGDHRQSNTVLIYPNYTDNKSFLSKMKQEQIIQYFSSIIVSVNKFLAPFERILNFKIIDRPFSTELGELTPKGTYKRRVIEENFKDLIETMYVKNTKEVLIKDVIISIPNWFLREEGTLSPDVTNAENGIVLPNKKIKLNINPQKQKGNIRIGNYIYENYNNVFELQSLLTNPIYWLGNKNLFEFTGKEIIQWSRNYSYGKDIKFISSVDKQSIEKHYIQELQKISDASEVSLNGLHISLLLIQSKKYDETQLGLEYLKLVLDDNSIPLYTVALKLLFHANIAHSINIRRDILKIALVIVEAEQLEDLLKSYLNSNWDILDEELTILIIKLRKTTADLDAIINVLFYEYEVLKNKQDFKKTSIPSLLNLLSSYGIQHPTSYKRIREVVVKFQLDMEFDQISDAAKKAFIKLKDGFRIWLGKNQNFAIDQETGEEYTWDDVLSIDPLIDEADMDILKDAIINTSLLIEVVFLFSKGVILHLNNLLPGGVWISQLKSRGMNTRYRAVIQTRFQGAFDIVFNINKTSDIELIKEEINWLIVGSSKMVGQKLVEDFGGYNENQNVWTQQYSHGESINKLIIRSINQNDEKGITRLTNLWPFIVWNAATAFFNFWKISGFKIMLTNPNVDNIIIPQHDYHSGTRIISLSERVENENFMNFCKIFYESFIAPIQNKYEILRKEKILNYMFSGIITANGEESGIKFLNDLRNSTKNLEDDFGKMLFLKVDEYLVSLQAKGFIPKRLFFAIKRFHRWFSINTDAAFNAQANMLKELYDTYLLSEFEHDFPETRMRFFLETAFRDSDEKVRQQLLSIVLDLHNKKTTKDDAITKAINIQKTKKLSDKELFFLTRLSYPHVKPEDSAEILNYVIEGDQTPNLVVQFHDYSGDPFSIRKPISPKEISKLHQLFIEANLLVSFNKDHEFLVALSERGYIIGGLFYYRQDKHSVHMEKIVVSNNFRRKGISEIIMNEFFSRMKNENIKRTTTGFFRPEYFYRFGFRIERKYSGLVKELK